MSFAIIWAILFSIILVGLFTLPPAPHDPVQERIDFMNSRKDNR